MFTLGDLSERSRREDVVHFRALRTRFTVCLLLLTIVAAVGAHPAYSQAPPPDPGQGLRIGQSTLRQSAQELVLRVQTDAPLPVGRLGGTSTHGLCLALAGRSRRSVFCFRPARAGKAVLRQAHSKGRRLELARGRVGAVRRSGKLLVARMRLSAAGVRSGTLRWWVTSWWPGSGCRELECLTGFPSRVGSTLRLRQPRLVGCSNSGSWFRLREVEAAGWSR